MRHNLCDFVKDGILTVDREYSILFANKALLGQVLIGGGWHGKTLPDIAGMKCHEALHSLTAPCEGRVARVVEAIDDITDKKKAEDELKARVRELQEFYDMAVGRELRMVELQGEIEGLREKLRP